MWWICNGWNIFVYKMNGSMVELLLRTHTQTYTFIGRTADGDGPREITEWRAGSNLTDAGGKIMQGNGENCRIGWAIGRKVIGIGTAESKQIDPVIIIGVILEWSCKKREREIERKENDFVKLFFTNWQKSMTRAEWSNVRGQEKAGRISRPQK